MCGASTAGDRRERSQGGTSRDGSKQLTTEPRRSNRRPPPKSRATNWSATRRAAIWTRWSSSTQPAQLRPARWQRPGSGWKRRRPACTHRSRARKAAIRRQRLTGRGQRYPTPRPDLRRPEKWWSNRPIAHRLPERFTVCMRAHGVCGRGQASVADGRSEAGAGTRVF